MGERGLGPPGEATGAGDQRSREEYADGQEVFERFADASLCDPQPAASEAKGCSDKGPPFCFALERREHLLCRVEVALIDERLHEQSAVHDAVHGRCGERGRGKRRPGVSLGGAQITGAQRQPAAASQAHGKTAAVAGRPRLRDRGIEQRPQLRVPLGPKQRERRLRKPACEREPGRRVRKFGRGLEAAPAAIGPD